MTEVRNQLFGNSSVTAGNSKARNFGNADQRVTVGYAIKSALGTPDVTVEAYFGDDTNGNKIWIPIANSGNAKDTFEVTADADQFHLKVAETGGADGLSDIYAWAWTEDHY